MKNAVMLTLATATLAFAACAQSKKTAAKKASASTVTAVRMDRGACFGRCPVYTLELKADGSARYTGKTFTDYQGVWQKNIGAAKAAAFLKNFDKVRVDTCQAEYRMLVSDLPSVFYSFTFADGSSKQISNANYGPEFLTRLARELDETVSIDRTWRKASDSTSK